MTSQAEKDLKIIRGEPVEISINKKTETVQRLTVDAQLEVMDLFVASIGDQDSKGRAATMIKVLSKCVGRELQNNDFASAAEMMEAFEKIWIQNEFDFLLKRVAALKQNLKAS